MDGRTSRITIRKSILMENKLNLESFKGKFLKNGWWQKLSEWFASEDAYRVYEYLKKKSKEKTTILPESSKTFDAFNQFDFKDLKIIIIAQEPYSTLIGNKPIASGVSLDCSETDKLQPSLKYFWSSIKNNFPDDKQITEEPNIKWLAQQGILFLNYSLTVQKNQISSHLKLDPNVFPTKNLWESFIKHFLQDGMYGTTGICYILMGLDSRKAKKYINPLGNYIFETQHPSFAARNNDDEWDADMVWKKCNNLLLQNNGPEYTIEYSKERWDFQQELKNLTVKDYDNCPF
jgi:uracil DNA glycosylase